MHGRDEAYKILFGELEKEREETMWNI